jgi:hypothetical protein
MTTLADNLFTKGTIVLRKSDNRIWNFLLHNYKELKLEEALDIFNLAADEYKINKLYHRQIEALLKVDEIHDKIYAQKKDRLEKKFQVTNLKSIIDLMLKENKRQIFVNQNDNYTPYDIITHIKKIILISEETAEDDVVLKTIDFIIKLYENNDEQTDLLIGLYEKQFEITGKYTEKYGDFMMKNKSYSKAAEIYELIGKLNSESLSLKWSCSRLFLKAIFSYILNGDDVYSKRKFDDIETSYPIVTDNRDFILAKNVLYTYLERNIERFTEYVYEYDQITRLDDFYVGILNSIKKSMSETEDLC